MPFKSKYAQRVDYWTRINKRLRKIRRKEACNAIQVSQVKKLDENQQAGNVQKMETGIQH